MSFFKKSKDEIEAEKLYSLLSNKTKNYTLDEIKTNIKEQGYSDSVSKITVKMITDNKLPLKESLSKNTKEDILKEISQTVNKKEEIKKEDLSKKEINKKEENKNLTNVKKVSFLKKTGNFFKRIYFFFEDAHYSLVDKISKVIPLNKLTDKIDKLFPSFILFLILLALLIYLIFSGTLSFSKTWNISVQVNDSINNPLHNALVNITVKDKNISSKETDVFGEALFKDLKLKKQTINLVVSKEHYNTENYSFKLNKNNISHTIVLSIDLNSSPDPYDEDREREISFVENENILITQETLNVTFSCTNPDKTPSPSSTLVTTGKIIVNTKKGCGSLRVSVISNKFSSITNQVVLEDNKVRLTRINNDRGKLGLSVKNISGIALSGSDVTVYKEAQSLLAHDILQTDIYGLGEFSLEPRNYFLTASKEGYLTYPKKGPFTVVKDSSISTNFILFTVDDLLNFNCNLEKYKPFCINNQIDCSNQHLKPFLKQNSDGTCEIGNPGYISVTLVDINTNQPVFADITLDSKLKDSDQNYSFTEYIAKDTNYHKFEVIDFYQYRIRVLNTEESGYLQPEPVVVNSLDTNIILKLEFSSELNSGTINVNVKDTNQNISNARVYLYRESDDGFFLVNNEPKFTNQDGDVNFYMQRANKEYYAYSLHNLIGKEGTSEIEDLDVNDFLELSVDLEHIPKMLNLKVNPNISYQIQFFDTSGEEITEYIVNTIDNNKQYIFTDDVTKVYAIVSSLGYTTYQTEIITLISGEEIFKEITLVSLASCEDTKLELIGIYNETGQEKINEIDFINYSLSDEYRLKFKYTSCNQDFDNKYVHIRAGDYIIIEDDYLFFVSDQINADLDVDRGYKFSGEHIPDFNHSLFSQNYSSDRSYNYQGDEYKWIEVDFSDFNVNILEFSLNLKFKNYPIVPFEYYNINYRSLVTKYQEKYSFDPLLAPSWNEISVYPDGYFYAKTNNYNIPFDDVDYIYQKRLKTWDNEILEPSSNGYILDIGTNYKYDVEYLYLKNSLREGSVLQNSVYTNDNLEYLSYGYVSSNGNSSSGSSGGSSLLITGLSILGDELIPVNINPDIYYHIAVNDKEYLIDDIDANRGYYLGTYSLFKAKGFFENTSYSNPKLVTNILNNYPTIDTKIYSYSSCLDYVFEITTENDDEIFVGQNNVSFKVLNNYGDPVENVFIRYQIGFNDLISLGYSNSSGVLDNQEINIPLNDLSGNIKFYFIFLPEHGFSNNVFTINRIIKSGVFIKESSIDLSIDYFKLNGDLFFKNKTLENYTVEKKTNFSSTLENIIFQAPSNVFNVGQTNNLLNNNNNIPKDLILGENIIITDFVINSSNTGNFTSNVLFRNEIDHNSVQEILDINAYTVVKNLGNINYIINQQPGVFIDGQTKIIDLELIKDVNPDINIDFNLSTSILSVLEGIEIAGSLPSFIEEEKLEESINISPQPINNQGILIPISFKIKDNYNSLFPVEDQNITLKFNLKIEGREVSFTQTFSLSAFNKDTFVSVTSSNNSVLFTCSPNDCSSTKTYTFKKNVKNYNVSLLKDVALNPVDNLIFVNNLQNNVDLTNLDIQYGITFTSEYASLQEDLITGESNVVFKFNILNQNVLNQRDINYTITKIPEYLLEQTLDFDYCVGVGGQNTSNDLFILGYCQEQEETCYSGADAVPKIFFNWGEDNLPSGKKWSDICIGENIDDMSSKYACDSLQALISISYKVSNGFDGPFYIKLLNDGVSKDLLKDFIDYIDDYEGYSLDKSVIKPRNPDLFTDDAVDNDNFVMTVKKNNNPVTEFSPGIYKVLVTSGVNFHYQNLEESSKLLIDLTHQKDLPASELSVFHYLPLDGSMNKEGERKEYGVNAINNGEKIDIIPDLNLSYNSTRDVTLFSFNRNNLSGIKEIIESEGTILDLKKLQDGTTISLEYKPSYPIPLMAHAACINDSNFSYNINYNDYQINNLPTPLFNWKYNNVFLKDKPYTQNNIKRYILETEGVEDQNILIKTMLYLPTGLELNYFKLMLDNFSNSSNTRVYTKKNLAGISNDYVFTDSDHDLGNNLTTLRTLQGIFDYVKDNKACIVKSPQRTYIKWNEDLNFTDDQVNIIISNVPEDFTCPTSNNLD